MADREDIRRALLGAHDAGRPDSSAAGVWMLQNARAFAEELAKFRRPGWKGIAMRWHVEFGVSAPDGGPYSGAAFAQAWLRVRRYLKDCGEEWVEIKPPPRGRGVRLVKRKRSAPEPVVLAEPVQTNPAPAPAPVPEGPVAAPAFADLLEDTDRSRSWLPKTKGK